MTGDFRVSLAAIVVFVGLTFTAILMLDARQSEARQHDLCTTTQNIYDQQFIYSGFLGAELHATPAQIEQGLTDLHHQLGQRPECN